MDFSGSLTCTNEIPHMNLEEPSMDGEFFSRGTSEKRRRLARRLMRPSRPWKVSTPRQRTQAEPEQCG